MLTDSGAIHNEDSCECTSGHRQFQTDTAQRLEQKVRSFQGKTTQLMLGYRSACSAYKELKIRENTNKMQSLVKELEKTLQQVKSRNSVLDESSPVPQSLKLLRSVQGELDSLRLRFVSQQEDKLDSETENSILKYELLMQIREFRELAQGPSSHCELF